MTPRAQHRAGWRSQLRLTQGSRAAHPAIARAAGSDLSHAPAPAAARYSSRPASIHVEVQELVLQGFQGANPRLIGASLETELASLLSSHDLPAAWRHDLLLKEATTAPLQLRSLSDGRRVGEQLAEAILGAESRR